MGVKLFTVLFIVLGIYLSLQSPQITQQNIPKKENKAMLEFENITIYDIQNQKLTNILKADKASKFKNKETLENIELTSISNNKKEILKSDQGTSHNDIIELNNNVYYKQNNKFDIKTNNLIYNSKRQTVNSKTSFVLNTKNMNINGRSFVYDKKEGHIKAKNIKAKINL